MLKQSQSVIFNFKRLSHLASTLTYVLAPYLSEVNSRTSRQNIISLICSHIHLTLSSSVLPQESLITISQFCGASTMMDDFKGRDNKKAN